MFEYSLLLSISTNWYRVGSGASLSMGKHINTAPSSEPTRTEPRLRSRTRTRTRTRARTTKQTTQRTTSSTTTVVTVQKSTSSTTTRYTSFRLCQIKSRAQNRAHIRAQDSRHSHTKACGWWRMGAQSFRCRLSAKPAIWTQAMKTWYSCQSSSRHVVSQTPSTGKSPF